MSLWDPWENDWSSLMTTNHSPMAARPNDGNSGSQATAIPRNTTIIPPSVICPSTNEGNSITLNSSVPTIVQTGHLLPDFFSEGNPPETSITSEWIKPPHLSTPTDNQHIRNNATSHSASTYSRNPVSAAPESEQSKSN